MLLVTGGTGNSGRYFFEKLAKENYTGKIRCIVRHDSQTTTTLAVAGATNPTMDLHCRADL